MDFRGEKLVIRLLDIIERNGISPFVDSLKARRDGMAAIDVQREHMLMLAKVEDEIAVLRSKSVASVSGDGGPALLTLAPPQASASDGPLRALAGHANAAFTSQALRQLRKEINVGKAIANAADALMEGDVQTPQEDPSPDWLERWRENASGVSVEKMQELWGQVLAREVRKPGSMSLRAMEVLKNLDSSDAALIERLAPFVVDTRFVHKSNNASPGWLAFGEALALQELGVIGGVGSVGVALTLTSASVSRFELGLSFGKYGLNLIADDPSIEVKLGGYKVTDIGREIMALVQFEPNLDYVKEVASVFKGQGVSVHFGLVDSDDGNETYFLRDPVLL
ncbi:TPA: DUF2806 domain-containing protein [Stenotrophomonas maltophilia]|nr:DUF2806 domain-containing protein [Stenotrophomonas maltophilia]